MRFAAAEAQLRGARLRAVRSQIELGLTATTFRSAPTSSVDALLSAERALLADAVDAVRAEHPTLLVESTLTDAAPHEALCDAAADAALLVVGCRRPLDSRLPHLGPHASWLLQHAPCPVAIVGQQSA
jgi:nucleotide-binding universal stress UspA family protein